MKALGRKMPGAFVVVAQGWGRIRHSRIMGNNRMAMSWKDIPALSTLIFVAGCGEPMQFDNAGSKHALAEDQRECDMELQSPVGAHYVKEAKGLVDPWQVCIERKGWKRVDRAASPSAGANL
jgi:hypothetical protein